MLNVDIIVLLLEPFVLALRIAPRYGVGRTCVADYAATKHNANEARRANADYAAIERDSNEDEDDLVNMCTGRCK